MTAASDVQRPLEAATGLDIRPRARRWAHLPVCVLDAVFSINARYTSTISVCDRYAKHQGLVPHLVDVADFATVAGTTAEQPVDALAELGRRLGPDRFAAEVLENRGRTSTRGGVLKADAAVRYAEVLADSGVHTLGDVTTLLSDLSRLDAVESRLRAVPGNGGHDVRLGYLWMLAGNDEQVKPDRKVLRRLSRHRAGPDALGARPRDLGGRLTGDLGLVAGVAADAAGCHAAVSQTVLATILIHHAKTPRRLGYTVRRTFRVDAVS